MIQQSAERFTECGPDLHPAKSKIVYCRDGNLTLMAIAMIKAEYVFFCSGRLFFELVWIGFLQLIFSSKRSAFVEFNVEIIDMKTDWKHLLIACAFVPALAVADWTSDNEQACDKNGAGEFKNYVLSLSWSPEFCRSHPSEKNEPQCKDHREFIVHGLWPQCSTGYPQSCKNGGASDDIDKQKIYVFMPSDYLIQHEWEKHGSCSGLSRSAYFNLTGEVFSKLNLPKLSGAPTAQKIESLFIENNPGLDADEIYLSCSESGPKKSNKTLDEVRICLDRNTQEFTRCEEAVDTCRKLKKVTITPAKSKGK